MVVFAILESCGDGYTYHCDNMLDSLWSTEELALKRLYFLEEYYKGKNSEIEYKIEEIPLDTLPNFVLGYYGNEEIDRLWAEQNK